MTGAPKKLGSIFRKNSPFVMTPETGPIISLSPEPEDSENGICNGSWPSARILSWLEATAFAPAHVVSQNHGYLQRRYKGHIGVYWVNIGFRRFRVWGLRFPKIMGTFLVGPYNKDCCISGFKLESPCFGQVWVLRA